MAPQFFRQAGAHQVVYRQPESADEVRLAMQILVSCPVGAIGTVNRAALKEVMADFPLLIEDEVYFCGFNSPKTAGAASYFIKHADGNWLVCAPKFLPQLVSKFEELGGLSYIFLTHRDDVGDSDKYAARFGARRIIHGNDLDSSPQAEIVIETAEPLTPAGISSDFLVIPQPGHTEGHCALLYRNKFLFSGDELKPDRAGHLLDTWDPFWTWYSFERQTESAEKLGQHKFQWILPSHGQRMKIDAAEVPALVQEAVNRARAIADTEPMTMERVNNLREYAADLRKWGQVEYAEKVESRAAAVQSKLGMHGTF